VLQHQPVEVLPLQQVEVAQVLVEAVQEEVVQPVLKNLHPLSQQSNQALNSRPSFGSV
jgi:hypothetical protein